MPLELLIIVSVIGIGMWMLVVFVDVIMVHEFKPKYIALLIPPILAAGLIGSWAYVAETNRGFSEETRVVKLVDDIAVVIDDGKAIQISKINGKSYRDGDVVKFKRINRYSYCIMSSSSELKDITLEESKKDVWQ